MLSVPYCNNFKILYGRVLQSRFTSSTPSLPNGYSKRANRPLNLRGNNVQRPSEIIASELDPPARTEGSRY